MAIVGSIRHALLMEAESAAQMLMLEKATNVQGCVKIDEAFIII